MASDLLTYAELRAQIDHPVDRVWRVVADFGGLDAWADGVNSCTADGEGPGAERLVLLGERTIWERLEVIDPVQHRLRYYILPPHFLPAENVHSDIILTTIAANRTEIRWVSEATNFQVAPDKIGVHMERFYDKSVNRLRTLLDEQSL